MNTTVWIEKKKKLDLMEKSNIINGSTENRKVRIVENKSKEELSIYIYKPKIDKVEDGWLEKEYKEYKGGIFPKITDRKEDEGKKEEEIILKGKENLEEIKGEVDNNNSNSNNNNIIINNNNNDNNINTNDNNISNSDNNNNKINLLVWKVIALSVAIGKSINFKQVIFFLKIICENFYLCAFEC
jgi:hypothetical protein